MSQALKDILNVALSKEIKAINTYSILLQKNLTNDLRNIIEELITFEKEHKKLIEQAILSGNLSQFGQMEEKHYEHITRLTDETHLHENFSIEEILQFAIKEEDKAAILYEKMYPVFKADAELAKVIAILISEECKHREQLEDVLKDYQEGKL